MDKETELMFKYEDKILDIIEHKDDFDTSDLQGVIETQLRKLIKEAIILNNNTI